MASDMDRDFFMTPTEAMQYGIIDEIIKTKTSHIQMPAMPALFDRVVKLWSSLMQAIQPLWVLD